MLDTNTYKTYTYNIRMHADIGNVTYIESISEYKNNIQQQ